MKNRYATSGFHGQDDASGAAVGARAKLHLVGDGGVLLDPLTQRIYRLNQASTLLWCCFLEGWSEDRVQALLEKRCGLSHERAEAYIATVLAEWHDLGLLDDGQPQGAAEEEGDALSPSRVDPAPPLAPVPPSTGRRLGYRILDSAIELRGLSEPLADAMDEALGHLKSTRLGTAPVICTLVETSHGYELTEGNRVIDRCSALDAVVPMVKAAIVRVAIHRATAFAIVHAAAVCRDENAVVLPGPAGSGKSTLAASLMLDGWTLAADDITILDHDTPFHVRPLPTALCLKTDSWPVVAEKAPEVDRLPIHRRADGQSVRYLPPRDAEPGTANSASVGVGLIAFPQYRAQAPLKVRRLNASEVFDRFLPQFYPVSNRFEGETMERVVGFLRQVPAIELFYGDGEAAAEAVRKWAQ
jgi:energy-coupling factor transporter ATP-binding protein EcfA2